MNNIFSFRRFAILLRKDITYMLLSSYNTLLVLLSLYAFLSVFSILTSIQLNCSERLSFFLFFTMLFVIMLPRMVYGKINDRRAGIEYAMLPVSFVEKFVSMVLTVGIVAPILFVCSMFIVDILLVLVSPENYGSIGYFWEESSGIHISTTIETFSSLFLVQTPFILGNLYFKSHKVSKTTILLLLIHIVVIFALLIFGYRYAVSNLFEQSQELEDQIYSIATSSEVWFEVIYTTVIPIALLVCSLFRIKNLQYK